MELLFKKCNPIRLLTIFPESSVVGFWLGFDWPLKYKTEIHEWKILSSASHSIEPWLIWFSYLTISISIGARQNRMRWLLSHQILIRNHNNRFITCSTANKGWSTVSYPQSLAFDHPYLSRNDHRDRWVFQEILLLFPKNYFEQSWTCYLGILTLLQKLQNKFVFFLSAHFLLVAL